MNTMHGEFGRTADRRWLDGAAAVRPAGEHALRRAGDHDGRKQARGEWFRATLVTLTRGREIANCRIDHALEVRPVRGRVQVYRDGEVVTVGLGDTVRIGAGVPHAIRSERGAQVWL
ncbi:MAG: hypothetical protein ACOC8B_08575, partial [Gemmatimonadota bacterium]